MLLRTCYIVQLKFCVIQLKLETRKSHHFEEPRVTVLDTPFFLCLRPPSFPSSFPHWTRNVSMGNWKQMDEVWSGHLCGQAKVDGDLYPCYCFVSQSYRTQLYNMFVQSWKWNALPFGKRLHICAQAPRTRAFWRDILREFCPCSRGRRNQSIFWLWGGNKVRDHLCVQQYWKVSGMYRSLYKIKIHVIVRPIGNLQLQKSWNQYKVLYKISTFMMLMLTLMSVASAGKFDVWHARERLHLFLIG